MPKTKPTVSKCRVYIAALLLALTSLLAAPHSAAAPDQYQLGMELTERLMNAEIHDYALLNVEQMLEQFPDRSEAIKIRKAEVLHKMGKRQEATELLDEIPDDSRFHYDAVRVEALLSIQSGDAQKAIKLFEEYFNNVSAPEKENSAARSQYLAALQQFAAVLMREKDARAANVLKKIQQLSAGGEDADETNRQGRYFQVKLTLDAQPDKDPDTDAVKDVLEELGNLKYGDDLIAALSYVERVRALLMLDRTEEALKLIDNSRKYLRQFDRAMREQGQRDASPMAGFYFYWGKALIDKALKARSEGDDAKAQEYLLAGLKRCRAVTKYYPNADEFPAKATVLFENIKKVLESEYDLKIKTEDNGGTALLESKLEEGDAFLQDGNYAKAAEIFLEGIQSAHMGDKVPQAGVRLAVCLAQTDRLLEAQAVCMYLGDLFPDSSETVDSFLKIGSILYKKSRSTSGEEAERAMEEAALMWDHFLELDPTHPKGQDIAFAIAEHIYSKAKEAAAESREIDEPEKKKQQQEKAFEIYREAIPKYEFLVENYGNLNRGIRALYKLGWIHYTLEDYETAKSYFQDYSTEEEQEKYGDDIVEAKFRVGEILLQQQDKPMEALEHFNELISWCEEEREPIDPTSKTVRQRKVDSYSYIGWCYDSKGETFRSKLNEFDDRIDDKQDRIKKLNEKIVGWRQAAGDADERIKEAKEQYKDYEQSMAGENLRKENPDEDDDGESAEDETDEKVREKQREIEAAKAGDRQERERQNLLNQLQGAKLDFERRDETARDELKDARAELEDARTELEDARAREQELRTQIEETEEELRTKTVDIRAARKKRQDLEEQLAVLQDELTEVKERTDARERAVRQKAQREKAELDQKVKDIREQLQAALEKEQEDASDEDVAERDRMREQLASMKQERNDISKKVSELDRKVKRLEAKTDIHEAAHEAFTAGLEINALQKEKFDEDSDAEKTRIQDEIDEQISAVLDKFKQWTDSIITLQVQIQNWAQNDIASAESTIEELEEEIDDLEQQKSPVYDTLEKWKRKAAESFEAFLADHPDNQTHSANNMSRVGGIYLEFNEFDKAVEWLEKLRSRFPDSKAGKKAMFDLGRALYENGQENRSAEVFGQAMADPSVQSRANLNYIARTMLDSGDPKLALEAAEELIQRSEDEDHEDYPKIQGNRREAALFRAGSAALQAENYRKAEEYITKLIRDNEQTGYFFDAMFVRAEANRNLEPPNYEAALKDLGQITLYAEDPVISNKAALRLGRMHQLRGQKKDFPRALSYYQQVVELADPETEGLDEIIEKAMYHSAQVYTELEDGEGQEETLDKYQSMFPNGEYLDEIRALPSVSNGN